MVTGQLGPRLIAHRGHSLGAPEQTMAAYEMAIRLGADMIEADVRRTRDGVLVMLHDATLDRTTDAAGAVAEQMLAEITSVDAGSWFGPEFRGARIPTLLPGLSRTRPTGAPPSAMSSRASLHDADIAPVSVATLGRASQLTVWSPSTPRANRSTPRSSALPGSSGSVWRGWVGSKALWPSR